MDNDDKPNPIDNLTPQQAQEALQNLWKQAFSPQKEILSDKNYPDLYQKVKALKQRLKKDYPDETFPEITVLKPGSFTNALASEKIKDALMAGKWGQYNVYGVNVPSEERNEEIAIHQWLIEKYPDAALGVIMHEYGHDARNIQYMPPEQRKTEECAADHFAAYYGGKEQLLEFLNIASGMLNDFREHPPTPDRIKALEDASIVAVSPKEVDFTPNCTLSALPPRPRKDFDLDY